LYKCAFSSRVSSLSLWNLGRATITQIDFSRIRIEMGKPIRERGRDVECGTGALCEGCFGEGHLC